MSVAARTVDPERQIEGAERVLQRNRAAIPPNASASPAGRVLVAPLPAPRFTREASLINAFLTWRHGTQGWAVSVWGRNLDNELHYAQVFGDAAIARAWLAPPRTYGVRLHYSL